MGWRPSPQMDSRSWTEVKVRPGLRARKTMISRTGPAVTGRLVPSISQGTEQLHQDGLAIRRERSAPGQGGPGHQGRGTGQHDPALPIGPVEGASAHAATTSRRRRRRAPPARPRRPRADVADGEPPPVVAATGSGAAGVTAWLLPAGAGRTWWGWWAGARWPRSRWSRGRTSRGEVAALVPEHLGEAVDLEGGRAEIGGHREVPLGVVADVRAGRPAGHRAAGRGQGGRRRRHHDGSEHAGVLVVRVQGHVEVVLAGGELVPHRGAGPAREPPRRRRW